MEKGNLMQTDLPRDSKPHMHHTTPGGSLYLNRDVTGTPGIVQQAGWLLGHAGRAVLKSLLSYPLVGCPQEHF